MKAIVALILFGCWTVSGKQALTNTRVEEIANAIYIVEGGTNAQVPYGILSVKVRDKSHAREICLNTVRNTYQRWLKAGAKGNFLNFLADRYCPPSDSAGNQNWKKNIQRILARNKPPLHRSRSKQAQR